MTINEIIEKFDEKFGYDIKYLPMHQPKDVIAFIRSSYSELLGEIVEEIKKRKNHYESQRMIFRDSKEVSIELRSRVEELNDAISIINSKSPKEDSIN